MIPSTFVASASRATPPPRRLRGPAGPCGPAMRSSGSARGLNGGGARQELHPGPPGRERDLGPVLGEEPCDVPEAGALPATDDHPPGAEHVGLARADELEVRRDTAPRTADHVAELYDHVVGGDLLAPFTH